MSRRFGARGIFQCLQGNRDREEVKRLILTASGAPILGRSGSSCLKLNLEALNTQTWDMGAKSPLNSATLMNKGLEFLEAMALYGCTQRKFLWSFLRVSIVHSCGIL